MKFDMRLEPVFAAEVELAFRGAPWPYTTMQSWCMSHESNGLYSIGTSPLCFRFEKAEDAVWFKLKFAQDVKL